MPRAHKTSETEGTDTKHASAAATEQPAGAGQPAVPAAVASGPVKKAHTAPVAPGKKATAKSASGVARTSAPAAKAGGEHVRKASPAKAGVATVDGAAGPAAKAANSADDGVVDHAFLAEQRQLLVQERAGYVRQAEELKAEADSLALEHEPGDVQFDEEGGEGGTSNVDRELDLVLSAQARSAILEIDRALGKIDAGSYGRCEQCGRPIPQARLQALPYAALCVACKSGGLSRR